MILNITEVMYNPHAAAADDDDGDGNAAAAAAAAAMMMIVVAVAVAVAVGLYFNCILLLQLTTDGHNQKLQR